MRKKATYKIQKTGKKTTKTDQKNARSRKIMFIHIYDCGKCLSKTKNKEENEMLKGKFIHIES